ncbi:hypothetical protein [Psychromicrobium sp. YIM B11713]|uniref:hypothetical protein n=1 Tax=Psychromicrobium sp. YIM B11713 TaxID=3145233 RepID=UPI00374E3EB5
MTDYLPRTVAPRHFHSAPQPESRFTLGPVHAAAFFAVLTATFLIATLVLILVSLTLGLAAWWIVSLAATFLCGAAAVWLTAKYR